jgi:Helix-turn-helix domain
MCRVELLNTRDVLELLGVSKQRVSALARDHRLIALPQGARMRFPAWQFSTTDPQDREALAAAHLERVSSGHVSPSTAASWFQEEHPELDARDPVSYLRDGGDRTHLLTVASRDAARLAQ